MDLGNLVEAIMQYLLIGGMTYLDHQDHFPMVNALVYACDSHWTGPSVNHNARLSTIMIYQSTLLHELLTLRGY